MDKPLYEDAGFQVENLESGTVIIADAAHMDVIRSALGYGLGALQDHEIRDEEGHRFDNDATRQVAEGLGLTDELNSVWGTPRTMP